MGANFVVPRARGSWLQQVQRQLKQNGLLSPPRLMCPSSVCSSPLLADIAAGKQTRPLQGRPESPFFQSWQARRETNGKAISESGGSASGKTPPQMADPHPADLDARIRRHRHTSSKTEGFVFPFCSEQKDQRPTKAAKSQGRHKQMEKGNESSSALVAPSTPGLWIETPGKTSSRF